MYISVSKREVFICRYALLSLWKKEVGTSWKIFRLPPGAVLVFCEPSAKAISGRRAYRLERGPMDGIVLITRRGRYLHYPPWNKQTKTHLKNPWKTTTTIKNHKEETTTTKPQTSFLVQKSCYMTGSMIGRKQCLPS